MARIRSIKPAFFRHRRLYLGEIETGLPLRIAFAGLWTCADREGRFRWEPEELKLDCLPYDEVDFLRVLDALLTRGFVVHYVCENREYGVIPGFKQHQVINNREAASDLPAPPKEVLETKSKPDASNTRAARVDNATITPLVQVTGEGKGREGKGREEDTPVGVSSKYAFEDGIIRLNRRDFDAWQKAYSHLDLAAELLSLSKWAESQGASWFHAVKGALAKRNREVKAEKDRLAAAGGFKWNGIEGVL